MSGGELNRFEFEKIKLGRYEVILCDETFANLDKKAKIKYIELLKNTVKKYNCYSIVIMHDEELIQYFDCIYEIKNHKLNCIKSSENLETTLKFNTDNNKFNSKLFYIFYKSKLRGNKLNWMFIFIIFSFLTTCILASARILTCVDRFYEYSINTLDEKNLLVNRVTSSATDEYVTIDIQDWSFPLSDNQISSLYNLEEIESIYPRYTVFSKTGIIIAEDLNLDKYCVEFINENGIYISEDMYRDLTLINGKTEIEIEVPVAQIKNIGESNEQLSYRQTVTTHLKATVEVRGILKDGYYEFSNKKYAYMNSKQLEEIVKNASETYQLKGNEEKYIPNLFCVKLKNFNQLDRFKQKLFELDQNLIVTSKREILENIRDMKTEFNSKLGNRVMLIGLSLSILILLGIRIGKSKKQSCEKDLLESYCVPKSLINKLNYHVILTNSIINGILAFLIATGGIFYLISRRLLPSIETLSLNYLAITLISISTCFIAHLCIKE